MSNLVRNSAKLLSANVIAQAIGLVVYPILTRLYSPEDFGVLNLFLSIGSIFILLSTIDYQYAIVLPEQEKDSTAIVHFSLLTSICVFLIVLFSVPFSASIANIFNTPSLAKWYFLLPFYILCVAIWNILSYWYIRHAEYNRNSSYQIMQSCLGAGMKLGFGYGGFLSGGMILSSVCAPFIALATSCLIAWKKHIVPLFCSIPYHHIREVATTYRKFPFYSFPSSLLNMLSSQLPILLLTPVFGNNNVGLWSMAILVGFAPLSMISKTLSQTLYQHTVDLLHQKQDIRPLYRQFSLRILVPIIPCFLLLWYLLPDVITFLLGSEWVTTGYILRWMLPWLLINLLTASTGFLAGIFFKQQIELYLEILLITLRICAIVMGIYTKDFLLFTITYSAVSFVVATIHYVWLMMLVKRSATASQ